MPGYNKVDDFVDKLVRGQHDFDGQPYKAALTNTAPTAASAVFSLVAFPDPVAANGYTSAGHVVTITMDEVGGVMTVQGAKVTILATAGGIGPFQYAIFYNSVTGGIVGYWDYGSAITLNEGESIDVKFDNASVGTIFTVE